MRAVSLLVCIHCCLPAQRLAHNRPSINRKDKGRKARWFVPTIILSLPPSLLLSGEGQPHHHSFTSHLPYSWTEHLSTSGYGLANCMHSTFIVYPKSNHFSRPPLPLPCWSKSQQPSSQNFGFYSEIDRKASPNSLLTLHGTLFCSLQVFAQYHPFNQATLILPPTQHALFSLLPCFPFLHIF